MGPVRISEIMPGPVEHRRVGINFPERAKAMSAAVKLWREFALDVTITNGTVYVECGPVIATHYLGMMERATGTPGFNEWDPPRRYR